MAEATYDDGQTCALESGDLVVSPGSDWYRCVTLKKSLHLSEPLFPVPPNGQNPCVISMNLTERIQSAISVSAYYVWDDSEMLLTEGRA